VSFAEQAPIARRQHHPERAAVFQPERQRPADERDIGDLEIRGSFDPVQARDRQAVAFEHPLIARDRVAHRSQDGLLVHEFTGTGQLLNECEDRVRHLFILPTITRSSYTCDTRVRAADLQNSPFSA